MKTSGKKFIKNKLLALISGLLFILFMTSCEDDNNEVVPIDVAYVSLYNASPNSPEMDIIVDNRQVNIYPFDYADYTGYLRFYTGDRNLKFGPYGASNVVEDTTVDFENGKSYSVFVVDEYPDVDALVLEDNAAAPSSGNAMIRFVHLSPDAPSVDLAIEGETDVLYGNQSFKDATDFTEISAEDYDFEVRDNSSGDVVLSIPDINIEPGWFYTIVVRGYANPQDGNPHVLSADVIVS